MEPLCPVCFQIPLWLEGFPSVDTYDHQLRCLVCEEQVDGINQDLFCTPCCSTMVHYSCYKKCVIGKKCINSKCPEEEHDIWTWKSDTQTYTIEWGTYPASSTWSKACKENSRRSGYQDIAINPSSLHFRRGNMFMSRGCNKDQEWKIKKLCDMKE